MYLERPPDPAVAEAIVCTWARGPGTGVPILVLPDGCTDLVWRSDGNLFVAGPDSGPARHPHPPGCEFVGARLRTGVAASILGVSVAELRDAQVPLRDLWDGAALKLADRLGEAGSAATRQELLVDAVTARLRERGLDRAVLAATRSIRRGSVGIGGLAAAVGLPSRTLHRRFVRQVGYAPKFYERVVRFQRFLDLGHQPAGERPSLAALAVVAGYADQAHLSRDCRQLADRTPRELLRV